MSDDMNKWLDDKKKQYETPSNCKIGEAVRLNFIRAGILLGCEVCAVRFTVGKVWYDIKIWIDDDNSTTIQNVDSYCVEKLDEPVKE